MNAFMVRLTTCFAVFAAGLLLYGELSEGARNGRIKLSTRSEKRDVIVTVTLRDLGPEYRWLSVYICTAEFGEENPQPFCNYFWERESGQEVRQDQAQYPFLFRNVPGGTLWVFAMAFDANRNPLARNQATVLRGRP